MAGGWVDAEAARVGAVSVPVPQPPTNAQALQRGVPGFRGRVLPGVSGRGVGGPQGTRLHRQCERCVRIPGETSSYAILVISNTATMHCVLQYDDKLHHLLIDAVNKPFTL